MVSRFATDTMNDSRLSKEPVKIMSTLLGVGAVIENSLLISRENSKFTQRQLLVTSTSILTTRVVFLTSIPLNRSSGSDLSALATSGTPKHKPTPVGTSGKDTGGGDINAEPTHPDASIDSMSFFSSTVTSATCDSVIFRMELESKVRRGCEWGQMYVPGHGSTQPTLADGWVGPED